MSNRTEYCALIGSSGRFYADRNCRWDAPTYVRRKFTLIEQDEPVVECAGPKHLWVNWSGNNPVGYDIQTSKPERGGYESYINMAYVRDGDVALQPCEYYQKHGNLDIHANTVLAWDDADYLLGNCLLDGTWRFIDSRGDGVFSAEQIATGGGFQNGMRNFAHNPTHAMRAATASVG